MEGRYDEACINAPLNFGNTDKMCEKPQTLPFLSCPLAVKRDIAVTIFLRCISVRACVRIRTGHNSYFYGWISKLFDTVVVLEKKKYHLKHFLGLVKVKVSHKLACSK